MGNAGKTGVDIRTDGSVLSGHDIEPGMSAGGTLRQECLLRACQVFFLMPFAAEPQLFVFNSIAFRHMHGAVLAGNHVAPGKFLVSGIIVAVLAGLEILYQAPEHPDNQAKNDESDQAHKKSL